MKIRSVFIALSCAAIIGGAMECHAKGRRPDPATSAAPSAAASPAPNPVKLDGQQARALVEVAIEARMALHACAGEFAAAIKQANPQQTRAILMTVDRLNQTVAKLDEAIKPAIPQLQPISKEPAK